MKIFWVWLVSVILVVSYGNPMGHRWEALEGGRDPNLQVTQDLVNERIKSQPFNESYQRSETNRQPNENEYHTFGNGDFTSSQNENFALNYKTDDEQSTQNKNSGVRGLLSNKNNIRSLSSSVINESPRMHQESSFNQQNIKKGSPFVSGPTPQIQTTIPSQETHRPSRENALSKAYITASHFQGGSQGYAPFFVERRRPEIQAEVDKNTFNGRLPEVSNQMSFEGVAFQNRNDFRSPVVYEYPQNQQVIYQNPSERAQAINDDSQHFTENPHFTKESQISSSQVPHEQVNQHQNSTHQNKKPSVFSFPTYNIFSPRETTFDSKRMSSSLNGQKFQPTSDADEKKYIYTSEQFEEQVEGKLQNRRISDNAEVQLSTASYFRDAGSNEQNPTSNHEQGIGSSNQGDYQNVFQSIRKQQPLFTVPHFQHQTHTSVALSGAKTALTRPVMVYKTESIASPHAVVLSKGSDVLGKASISHYLQTPHAKYTYNHSL